MIRKSKSFAKAMVVLIFAFSSLILNAQGGVPATYFSSDKINSILDHRDCVGVRFYNVVKNSNSSELTVMAIGIKADGSEIYSSFNADRKYQVAEGINQGGPVYQPVSKSTAADLCAGVVPLGQISFSADFTTSELTEAMSVRNCTGTQVEQTTSGSDQTFSETSAILSGQSVSIPSDAKSFTCDDPCPSMCDSDDDNYINK